MARTRTIKPGFFANEKLAELPCHTRLLFVGLWTIADREGRLEDRPRRIKAAVFPYDRVDVDKGLQALMDSGFITRYQTNRGNFIAIPSWLKHQNPHHKEVPSEIPPPPGSSNRFNHTPVTDKLRQKILERDGNKCILCGATEDLNVDHIVPVILGGTSDENNLRTLCAHCNNRRPKSKHDPSMTQASFNVGSTSEPLTQTDPALNLNPSTVNLNPSTLNPEPDNASPAGGAHEPEVVGIEPEVAFTELSFNVPDDENGLLFKDFMGCFIALGVAMNERDIQNCAGMWAGHDLPTQRVIVADVKRKIATGYWSERPAFPWNYLYRQEWTRRALPRSIPNARPQTRAQAAQDEARRRFMEGE